MLTIRYFSLGYSITAKLVYDNANSVLLLVTFSMNCGCNLLKQGIILRNTSRGVQSQNCIFIVIGEGKTFTASLKSKGKSPFV